MTIGYPGFYTGKVFAADDSTEANLATLPLGARVVAGRGAYRRFFKRMLDITAIVLAAPAVVPVIAVAAVLVARDGGSPFYTQMRVGRNGRAFRMLKLRSMSFSLVR